MEARANATPGFGTPAHTTASDWPSHGPAAPLADLSIGTNPLRDCDAPLLPDSTNEARERHTTRQATRRSRAIRAAAVNERLAAEFPRLQASTEEEKRERSCFKVLGVEVKCTPPLLEAEHEICDTSVNSVLGETRKLREGVAKLRDEVERWAASEARRLGISERHSTLLNARKHFIFAASASYLYGVFGGSAVTAHESVLGGKALGPLLGDRKMDLLNNEVGFDAADRTERDDLPFAPSTADVVGSFSEEARSADRLIWLE